MKAAYDPEQVIQNIGADFAAELAAARVEIAKLRAALTRQQQDQTQNPPVKAVEDEEAG